MAWDEDQPQPFVLVVQRAKDFDGRGLFSALRAAGQKDDVVAGQPRQPPQRRGPRKKKGDKSN